MALSQIASKAIRNVTFRQLFWETRVVVAIGLCSTVFMPNTKLLLRLEIKVIAYQACHMVYGVDAATHVIVLLIWCVIRRFASIICLPA